MKNNSQISCSNNVGSDQHITSKSLVVATCFVILLIGLSGWFFTNVVVRYGTNNERRNFLSRAETAASTFNTTLFAKLSGKPEDVKTDNYTLILAQLIRIRDINKDVRFVYLMRMKDEKIIFLADAEPESSEDYSAHGDIYDEASPELYNIFKTGKSFIEGPLEDRWGIWISAIAPIMEHKSNNVTAIIGLDIDARNWQNTISVYRWFSLSITGLVMFIVLIFSIAMSRNTTSNNKLREEIAERKQAEEKLRRYRGYLEELVTERTGELEKKALELEEANLRLKESDRLKSVFLACVSHELRTPLNAIIGFTGIILQGMVGEINEEQKKQLFMVKNSADHLLNLVYDILDIAEIEAGRAKLSLEEFELDALIGELEESLSPAAKEKGLELITDAPKGIIFLSDRRRIKQVLMNLLGNAVKFTDKGSVRVATIIAEDENIKFSVTDTGIGIREADMNKLFQPFLQLDLSHKKRHEGNGLGLHLTRKLADLLGGSVSATSEFGKGSEFIFTLPLKHKGIGI